jgi:hypothetical protein
MALYLVSLVLYLVSLMFYMVRLFNELPHELVVQTCTVFEA